MRVSEYTGALLGRTETGATNAVGDSLKPQWT